MSSRDTTMKSCRATRVFLVSMVMGTAFVILLTNWARPGPIYRQLTIEQVPQGLGLDQTRKQTSSTSSSSERGFLLDSDSCKIPDLDPFDPSIMKDMPRRRSKLCKAKPSITYIDGSVLRINRTVVDVVYHGDFKHCNYQPLARGHRNSDFAFIYGEMTDDFDHDIELPPEHEFIRIYCYSKSEGRIMTNFHAAVTPKKDVEKRSNRLFEKHKRTREPKETFNVHMIGVDSVSRLNFIRQMRLTRKFLLDDLKGFEMTGYNKVADNTFVNIIPMMMGKFVSEIGWNETMLHHPFDDYNFFWKNFSNAGYRTLYAEDAPKIAIFVYAKEGFHKAPADYYNRPLALAMERHRSVWSRDHHCIVDRLETTMLLDYVTDFSKVFQDQPHFGFTFITRLTHDSIGLGSVADQAYYTFLKRFKDDGHFENTVLIFYSDHGYRFGGNRNTYTGKIEERLPFMFLVFPPKFHEKYPQLVANLHTNSRRLTTPFDIYETLKDILYFDGLNRMADVRHRGISLLRKIPASRTCEHAQILPHWCLCLEQKSLNPKSKLAVKIGRALVTEINKVLSSSFDICSPLKLDNISDVVKMESNDKVLRFEDTFHDVINRTVVYGKKTVAPVTYQITLTTRPGYGLFEATLSYRRDSNSFRLAGDVSRINAYSDQSVCIDNFKLKKFCFCLK